MVRPHLLSYAGMGVGADFRRRKAFQVGRAGGEESRWWTGPWVGKGARNHHLHWILFPVPGQLWGP